MKGRKPKPSYLRIMEGMPGHRPLNADEPEVDGDLHEPPAHLSARQQYYWRENIKNAPLGMLKSLDVGVLSVYCQACEELEMADAKIREDGEIIQAPGKPSGFFVRNPFLRIRSEAQALVLKAAAELGFTPSSRSRVKVTVKKNAKSAFRKLRELKLPG